jgi:hypothetical protein
MKEKKTKRTERLQVMLEPEELEALDDWRFENRLPTRAAAVRELLRRGLSIDKAPDVKNPAALPSAEFGVIDEC